MSLRQTRLGSLTESVLNVIVGAGITLAAQSIVFPLFGVHLSVSDNLKIMSVFTVVSVARSYLLRRAFEWAHRHGCLGATA